MKLKNKKRIGKQVLFSILFIVFPFSFFSQCIGIKDLVSIFEGDEYALNNVNYYKNSTVSTIDLNGYILTIENLDQYVHSDDQRNFLIQTNFDGFLCYTLTLSNCFQNIKAQVAKEVGNKVYPKKSSEVGSWEIDSYEHSSKDLYIQFYKSTNSSLYKIILINSDRISSFQNQIKEQVEQQLFEEKIQSIVDKARIQLQNKNYNLVKNYLNECQYLIGEKPISSTLKTTIESLTRAYHGSRLKDIDSEVNQLILNNQFVKAKNRLQFAFKNDPEYTSELKYIEKELQNKAVDYYNRQSNFYYQTKNYLMSSTYSDSILLFSPANKSAMNHKKNMRVLIEFLKERESRTYDYWESNLQVKNQLIDTVNSLIFNYMSNYKKGQTSFEFVIESDTFCQMTNKIIWNTKPLDCIQFNEHSLRQYNLTPFQKFDYCCNSKGNLVFSYNWSSQLYKFKYILGEFKSKRNVESKVANFITNNYPTVKGKLIYTQRVINFNGVESFEYTLNKFSTRGPINAFYSLLLPGLGTKRVTYGNNGNAIIWCFFASLATATYGSLTDNSLVTEIGAVALGSTYVWDITNTIVKGANNLTISKVLRSKLKHEIIKL